MVQEQGNARQVWELGHRAEMLADSPLLAAADRAAILRRIERAPEAMQLAMRQEPWGAPGDGNWTAVATAARAAMR